MTKVVINTRYGGFSLSAKALDALAARKGRPLEELDIWDLDRTDPDLVAVVEALGYDASGDVASLEIVEVPAGTLYRIHDYDGNETIETRDSIKWLVA